MIKNETPQKQKKKKTKNKLEENVKAKEKQKLTYYNWSNKCGCVCVCVFSSFAIISYALYKTLLVVSLESFCLFIVEILLYLSARICNSCRQETPIASFLSSSLPPFTLFYLLPFAACFWAKKMSKRANETERKKCVHFFKRINDKVLCRLGCCCCCCCHNDVI